MDHTNLAQQRTLREEMVRWGKRLYESRLVVSNDGNLSCRLGDGRVLATPSGLCKGEMHPDQLIVTDLNGQRVGPETEMSCRLNPTSEIPMHLEILRRRPDVQAVMHAHPPITVALSIAGVSLAQPLLPEVIVGLGLVPTTEYATPSSEENVLAIRDFIAQHDVIVLRRHGALTVGRSMQEAFFRMETLEHFASILYMLTTLGRAEALPPFQVEKLLETRRKLGLSRPGEEHLFSQAWGTAPCDSQR